MRARIPVTTETTRHMSEMYQQTMDGSSISSCESYGTHERKSSLTSPIHSHSFTEKDRRKSAPVIHGEGKETRHERKSSDSSLEFKNYKRPLTPPPARPIQPIEEVMPPYSSLPLSPPPNRVMSPTPSRERLCTPPPPPTHSNICNMRERLTSPPPPPIQRVMSPPTVNREMTSHSRSSSSSSHYSNLSTEDHFPVPPESVTRCHRTHNLHLHSCLLCQTSQWLLHIT
ncbi:unnamed protein product [Mytilus edulis]|uniref:Uncharacterized protein n=1 Tax=Mytilus edulis TaxID=6550 RepID=A0A8S3PML3_MYTED|nr:unnamed protein product [Mytilus edulis]